MGKCAEQPSVKFVKPQASFLLVGVLLFELDKRDKIKLFDILKTSVCAENLLSKGDLYKGIKIRIQEE